MKNYEAISSSEEDRDGQCSVENAIEQLGIGWYQYSIGFTAGLCLSADGIEILLLSFLSIVLQVEWNLTASQGATITSCVFLGSLIGTLIQGPLGDRLGRRPVFLLASGSIACFGFATALATNLVQLIIFRFMVGVGLGGCFVPFDALSEVLPTAYRGKNLMYLEFLWTAGTMAVPIIAYFSLGRGHGSWQIFVAACAVPCTVAVVFGYFFVPESPRWLCTHGRSDEALRILRRAASLNGKDPNVLFPQGTVLVVEDQCAANICELASPRWRPTTLKLIGTGFGEGFLYYGAVLAITLVFSTTSKSSAGKGTYNFNYGAIFTSCSAEVFGTILVILIVDSFGRIRTQELSWVAGGFSTAMMCLLAPTGSWVLVVLAFLARVFMMSGSSTLWISVAEIMTTDVRTTGHSVVFAAGRVGGFLCAYVVNASTPLGIIAIVVLGIALFCTACIACLPETKGVALGEAVVRVI